MLHCGQRRLSIARRGSFWRSFRFRSVRCSRILRFRHKPARKPTRTLTILVSTVMLPWHREHRRSPTRLDVSFLRVPTYPSYRFWCRWRTYIGACWEETHRHDDTAQIARGFREPVRLPPGIEVHTRYVPIVSPIPAWAAPTRRAAP